MWVALLRVLFVTNMLLSSLKRRKTDLTQSKIEIPKGEKIFPSPSREWTNSIYAFDKNITKHVPFAEALAMQIIKSYFSMYNKALQRKTRTRRMLARLRKYSSNKIYFARAEFKHTNNKVLVNLYLFNRQKVNYFHYLKKWYLGIVKTKTKSAFIKRLHLTNKQVQTFIESLDNTKALVHAAIRKNVTSHISYELLSSYLDMYNKKLLMRYTKRIKTHFYYRQLLYINRNMFNYNLLQYLQKHLERIYNKNIEFNLFNLRRFFLNSDILSNSITAKIARNRRRLLKYLNALKDKVKIRRKRFNFESPAKSSLNIKFNTNSEKLILERIVFDNLKHKHVSGFRLEGKGRLTRRYTASRSISKIRYKGNLLDIHSSNKGLSTLLLKGGVKSNLQITQLESKTRIGSFGIKGWISSN